MIDLLTMLPNKLEVTNELFSELYKNIREAIE
jgi:hypothetical protein